MIKKKILKIPAFWDLHIHGVSGIDFMHATPQEMLQVCEILGKQGIAAFCPTLLTAETKLFEKACANWGRFLSDLKGTSKSRNKSKDIGIFLSPTAAIPIGLHLEGPFLNSKMSGAHPKSNLKLPNLNYFKKLEKLSSNQISILTIAPELKSAQTLIKYCRNKKIITQIGHTNAQYSDINAAISAGATGITHLYNAMHIHHRNPGVLPFLQNKRLVAELITDGIHLDKSFTDFLMKIFPQQLYAVTDACSALCSKKSQNLTLGTLKLIHLNGCGIVKNSKILAGGATRMVDHPKLYKPFNNDPRIFEFFYKIPAKLFPKIAKLVKTRKNIFEKNTWSFVQTEA